MPHDVAVRWCRLAKRNNADPNAQISFAVPEALTFAGGLGRSLGGLDDSIDRIVFELEGLRRQRDQLARLYDFMLGSLQNIPPHHEIPPLDVELSDTDGDDQQVDGGGGLLPEAPDNNPRPPHHPSSPETDQDYDTDSDGAGPHAPDDGDILPEAPDNNPRRPPQSPSPDPSPDHDG